MVFPPYCENIPGGSDTGGGTSSMDGAHGGPHDMVLFMAGGLLRGLSSAVHSSTRAWSRELARSLWNDLADLAARAMAAVHVVCSSSPHLTPSPYSVLLMPVEGTPLISIHR